jgi:hypothetical protein
MKKTHIGCMLAVVFTVSGCGVGKKTEVATGGMISPGNTQVISEQRVVNEFKRKGIRVVYTITGNLEAVESTGYAPIWGNSQNSVREAYRVAELEAKKAMNDFINTESISSSVSVSMISSNIEKARDNRINNIATNRARDEAAAITDDEDFKGTQSSNNTATRNDALKIASKVNTEMTLRSQGILGGMQLVEGEVINGRTVRVVYRWDKKADDVRVQIRNSMMR